MCQKAKRSYQKDLATFQEARETNAQALVADDINQGINGSAMPGGDKFLVLNFEWVLVYSVPR